MTGTDKGPIRTAEANSTVDELRHQLALLSDMLRNYAHDDSGPLQALIARSAISQEALLEIVRGGESLGRNQAGTHPLASPDHEVLQTARGLRDDMLNALDRAQDRARGLL